MDGSKYALCVGINYKGSDTRIPRLRFAEQDAQDIAILLEERAFQVTTLLGSQATRRALYNELNSIANTQADLCVLYFSGHGLRSNQLLNRDQAYFAPYDFDPGDTALGLALSELAE